MLKNKIVQYVGKMLKSKINAILTIPLLGYLCIENAILSQYRMYQF